jgi:transposase
MVAEVTPNYESQWAAIGLVAQKLGVGSAETVRKWVRQAEVNAPHTEALSCGRNGRQRPGWDCKKIGSGAEEVVPAVS